MATQTKENIALRICDCGQADYRRILEFQLQLHRQRQENSISNTVLLVEHQPVITLGARKKDNKLLISPEELKNRGINVVEIRRGGAATAHNLGQLVFYPILDLRQLGLGISDYIRELEQIGIELLKNFDVNSTRKKGYPGLWVGTKKIASIGVRISRFVTYHGMAININNDLGIFDLFVPCGIKGIEMTSVQKETGKEIPMTEVKKKLSQILESHLSIEEEPGKKTIRRLPDWLKRPMPAGKEYCNTDEVLSELGLETICTNANCPNRGECWNRGTATVLILGNICTRSCRFCSVAGGKPLPPDSDEPSKLAEMAMRMKLKYLVITSVNRDDLPDGGAGHFRDCVLEVKRYLPDMKFEILTPDFKSCQQQAIEILADALPFVFAHNVETVPSLYSKARQGGDYQRSLNLLKKAKEAYGNIETKSSIMLGLGESDDEVEQVLRDLRSVGIDRMTIGQYLKPSRDSLDVVEYIGPEKFEIWKQKAIEAGFDWVMSGPFVRSSYLAEQEKT